MSEAVRYDRVGPVAWVTIDRPEARNAINAAVRDGLREATARFNDDDAAVLVLTGSGDVAFCAGADLKEMSAQGLEVPPPDYVPVFGRTVRVDKPTIAAVNGVALAGRLPARPDVRPLRRGRPRALRDQRGPRRPRRAVGGAAALARPPAHRHGAAWSPGSRSRPQRAYEVGLVNRVVPMAGLHDAVQELAEGIASNAPLSVAAGKRTVYLAMAAPYEEADAIWEPVYRSADAQEGPRAFAEKRPPRWQGR